MNADNDDLQKNSAREVFKENVPLQAKITFDKAQEHLILQPLWG